MLGRQRTKIPMSCSYNIDDNCRDFRAFPFPQFESYLIA